jgi:hypothetical protein
LRFAPSHPARPDETPVFTYVCAAAPTLSIEPSTAARTDHTPRCAAPSTDGGDDQEDQDGPLRFGDWLVRRGLISRIHLFCALSRSRKERCRIGDALVALALLDRPRVEEEAAAFVAFSAFQTAPPLTGPLEE